VTAVDSDATRLSAGARIWRGSACGSPGAPDDAAQAPTGGTASFTDRILLDAPCSASGIVRRHPDVRWLRRRSDLATLSRRQTEMLERLWPLLAAGW
jgi:16S rRNA (cytosine967-C5)-methyltransferase